MTDARDAYQPELAAALRHMTGADLGQPVHPPGREPSSARVAEREAEEAAALAATAARLVAGARRSARSALSDRVAALLAEVGGRCHPPLELRPDDIGPDWHRLPSELTVEARRLASRVGLDLTADVLSPTPDEPRACRDRFERLLDALTELEGQSVRVTDARLHLIRHR